MGILGILARGLDGRGVGEYRVKFKGYLETGRRYGQFPAVAEGGA